MRSPCGAGAFACQLLLLLQFAAGAFAQGHATWSVEANPSTVVPGGGTVIQATARIEPGWHLYSASSPSGLPTTFQVEPGTLEKVFQPPPKKAFDKTANAEAETYEGKVTFLLEVNLPDNAQPGPAAITAKARFQICNDSECVPGKWTGTAPVTFAARNDGASDFAFSIPSGYAEAKPPAASSAVGQSPAPPAQGWAAFLLVAFGFGLASIFTPCVFPMIPITMSYFLNRQSGGRRDGIVQAVVFCLGIIVLFSGLGLLVTAILGPFGVAKLGANPWVNGFIAALFIAFGLSLLGAFEIAIPSAILTRLNQSSDRGGFAGALLMGLTFSLASFACVGPFVGTLLAASAGAGGVRPPAGMLAFAAGLALPFFLLALFPAYLKRLPKSGGWLPRVKVVMGFVILAASLKYLSSLDQAMQWGFLTRERFLAIWIVLFAMTGLYLLGFVRLEGIQPDQPLGLGRLLLGMAFLVFAVSLAPGMSGGKLGELDAYVPEAVGQALSPAGQSSLTWMKNDYRGALDRARREGKLVFVNFTGYACTNCHWMEANMFTRPEIAAALGGFILVDLYTDGTDAASDANGQLELAKFQTAAEPFYAIIDPDEKVIATSAGVTRDPQVYLAFLKKWGGPPGLPSWSSSPSSSSSSSASPSSSPSPPLSLAPGIPDLPTTTLQGAPLTLAGHVVVVNFWATWCVPCVAEIPGFNRVYHQFSPQGVAMLGVAMDDEGKPIVDPFLQKHPIDYPVALGSDALADKFGLAGYPVTLVFDPSGKQVKRFDGLTGEADLEAAVRQAM